MLEKWKKIKYDPREYVEEKIESYKYTQNFTASLGYVNLIITYSIKSTVRESKVFWVNRKPAKSWIFRDPWTEYLACKRYVSIASLKFCYTMLFTWGVIRVTEKLAWRILCLHYIKTFKIFCCWIWGKWQHRLWNNNAVNFLYLQGV